MILQNDIPKWFPKRHYKTIFQNDFPKQYYKTTLENDILKLYISNWYSEKTF